MDKLNRIECEMIMGCMAHCAASLLHSKIDQAIMEKLHPGLTSDKIQDLAKKLNDVFVDLTRAELEEHIAQQNFYKN